MACYKQAIYNKYNCAPKLQRKRSVLSSTWWSTAGQISDGVIEDQERAAKDTFVRNKPAGNECIEQWTIHPMPPVPCEIKGPERSKLRDLGYTCSVYPMSGSRRQGSRIPRRSKPVSRKNVICGRLEGWQLPYARYGLACGPSLSHRSPGEITGEINLELMIPIRIIKRYLYVYNKLCYKLIRSGVRERRRSA